MRSMLPTDILISTSRKPSQRTRSLCKELQLLLPSSLYIQRGKSNFEELLQASEQANARLLLLIGERDGNPGSFDLYSLKDAEEPVLSFEIDGVRLAREFGVHVGSRSKAITISSDSKENSIKLQKLFKRYLDSKPEKEPPQAGTRILSVSAVENARLRFTFKDLTDGHELGPSITGCLIK